MVIHTNGIHMVGVDFCRCRGVPHHKQLLRIAWWPATPLAPKTCATMECLRQFHLLNLQANVTAFGYYSALQHLSDNVGLEQFPVSHLPHSVIHVCIDDLLEQTSVIYSHDTRVSAYKDAKAQWAGV